MSELGLGVRALGNDRESGFRGERDRRLITSSSCPSRGGVLIRHLVVAVAASCAVIEVSFSFSMIYCEKSL